jgi:hypothetical protein
MHDQVGMRAIGAAVTALADDPYPSAKKCNYWLQIIA